MATFEKTPDLTVAKTILEQLGGRHFLMMTGAKNLVGSDTSLTFRIARSKDGSNTVRITLTPLDVYTVETFSVRKVRGSFEIKSTPKSTVTDVYCDTLRPVFEKLTGLRTRLF